MYRQEDPNTPSRRTLFSLGWPPYCSGNQVEAVFSRAGIVTATYLQQTAGQVLKEVFLAAKASLSLRTLHAAGIN